MILPMENTEKTIFPGVGKYGIPAIKPETDIRIDKLERYVRRIFLCIATCRWRCSFSCTTKSTGWLPTGKPTESM